MKRSWPLILILAIFLVIRLYALPGIFFWNDEVDIISAALSPDASARGILATSFHSATVGSSSPWLPLLLLHGLIRIFGPYALVLRLPSVVISLVSFFIFAAILRQLFSSRASRIFPLLILSFSLPSIMYGQSPQPIIYFFLSTLLQLLMLIQAVSIYRTQPSRSELLRGIALLTHISIIAFLCNYMSLLIYGLCLCYLLTYVFTGRQRLVPTALPSVIGDAALSALPLVILGILRLCVLSKWKHRVIYDISGVGDIFRLGYDFLSYHFNFAFNSNYYLPLGSNLLSLPFVVLVLFGALYFLYRHPQHRLPALVTLGFFLIAVYLRIMPFGGVRHSLTLAPILFICLGYGVAGIIRIFPRCVRAIPFFILSGMGLYAALLFIIFGTNYYVARKATLDLNRIIFRASEAKVTKILAFERTYEVLKIMDYTAGNILARNGLELLAYDFEPNVFARYLLVAYRHGFNPETARMVNWPFIISDCDFSPGEIEVLEENIGPLDPETMVRQSIYYPINGSFIYLIDLTSREVLLLE